jgi:1,4-alpha-glucan branching enzyme
VVRHLAYAWKLWRESKGTNVIYALDPISVGAPAALVARMRRVPFLVRLGGDYAWEQGRIRFGITDTLDDYLEKQDTAPLPVRLLATVQTKVVQRADRVIVPSKYLRSVVERWGISRDRITVIYSALFPLEVSTPRQVLREELQYSHPTIVSAGRLVPWKGFAALIEVVARLKAEYPHISLIIVGDGEEMPRLKERVAKHGLLDSVRFTGRISKDALGATIKAADVFVLNTAYEGLSHQLIEVMDLGVPIVTTTAGGNSELIENGVNGYLVEFNNVPELQYAINRVLHHPESRERLVQSARGRSKEFSKEKVVGQVAALLRDVHGS